jgi:4-hydroxyphenylpyruvate dioxygenase
MHHLAQNIVLFFMQASCHLGRMKSASVANPCGLQGLSFLELTAPDPAPLHRLLLAFGFSRTMRHRAAAIDLYEQGEIRILLNQTAGGFAAGFAAHHGPSICSMGWRVADGEAAVAAAAQRGGAPATGELRRARGEGFGALLPAIVGIGESLIYFVEGDAPWAGLGFEPLATPDRVAGKGFVAIDHLTNNVARGELGRWASFYRDVFGFTDVRYFDIRGAKTGLTSFAMRSPCGTFCIPINEGTERHSQINEYLDEYKGPGIQHVAFLTDDILGSLRALEGTPIEFLDIDADYYGEVFTRLPQVTEDHAELARRNVLVDGDEQGYLLQIFTRNLIGPIFIELIQRKNHLSFGEGNFGALFRSIERDQVRRGYLA